jgi:HAE1 family hydrophobic/amphiphilic exporter-1
MRPQLPPGMRCRSSPTMRSSSSRSSLRWKEHLIEGTLLAALVVWVLPALAALDADHLAGHPGVADGRHRGHLLLRLHLNSLTMLALLLLIGVVVDDAIVVLENIFRHREDLDPTRSRRPSTAATRWSSR